jgi:hypothetical protein
VGAAVFGGSVAVAQSALAPDGVHESIRRIEEHAGLRLTTEPVKIADIHLSDGTRWQVWRGLNDHAGSCWTAGDPGNGPVERDAPPTNTTDLDTQGFQQYQSPSQNAQPLPDAF